MSNDLNTNKDMNPVIKELAELTVETEQLTPVVASDKDHKINQIAAVVMEESTKAIEKQIDEKFQQDKPLRHSKLQNQVQDIIDAKKLNDDFVKTATSFFSLKDAIIIAAMSDNRVIGQNNKLPWSVKGDMDFFKRTTINNTVLMGRNTYDSLKKPLKHRKNVVLTSRPLEQEGVVVIKDVGEYDFSKEQTFCIGGAQLYKYLLGVVNKLYITHIKQVVDGDNLTMMPIFEDVFKVNKTIEETPEYCIVEYLRA